MSDNNETVQSLFDAVKQGNVGLVEELMQIVDPAARCNHAIVLAAEYGHIEVVRLLLGDPRVSSAENLNDATGMAALRGHTGIVKLLLANPNVNPAGSDNHAFAWATLRGHVEIVRLLLADPRVDPAAEDNRALGVAVGHGHVEVVRLLLADPRVNDLKFIHSMATAQETAQQPKENFSWARECSMPEQHRAAWWMLSPNTSNAPNIVKFNVWCRSIVTIDFNTAEITVKPTPSPNTFNNPHVVNLNVQGPSIITVNFSAAEYTVDIIYDD